jgi:pseudouridine synthase
MRINKYLALHGYASRRKADELILDGKVTINGKTAVLGDQVDMSDVVEVSGIKRDHPNLVYYLLNKPVGYICTTDKTAPGNVLELVPKFPRVFPVGRLDVASSGALLITNDGDLANRLLHPRYGHEKTYEVTVDRPIHDLDLKILASGIKLEDGMTQKTEVKRFDVNKFQIILKEGRNRQIRRMCEAIDHNVRELHRTTFAGLSTTNLKPGAYRNLLSKEIKKLKH